MIRAIGMSRTVGEWEQGRKNCAYPTYHTYPFHFCLSKWAGDMNHLFMPL